MDRTPNPANRFTCWIPPDKELVKLYTDVAVDSAKGVVGFGIALRDWKGYVLLCASKPLIGALSPKMLRFVLLFMAYRLLLKLVSEMLNWRLIRFVLCSMFMVVFT
ncbi:hypothetical protein ACOSQ2_012473 [Xanthoceras sorbifolium]